jgi:hypothetical protein
MNARGTTVVVATHDRELIAGWLPAITLEHGHLSEVCEPMKHALNYAFDEAFTSLWRGDAQAFVDEYDRPGSFVLGVFLLATTNLQRSATSEPVGGNVRVSE